MWRPVRQGRETIIRLRPHHLALRPTPHELPSRRLALVAGRTWRPWRGVDGPSSDQRPWSLPPCI